MRFNLVKQRSTNPNVAAGSIRNIRRSKLTYIAFCVEGRLLGTNAGICYFNDMFQLPGLLLDFSCQEQRSLGNDLWWKKKTHPVFTAGRIGGNYGRSRRCGGVTYISVEFREGVDHIKPVHVYYSCVDYQLRAGQMVKAEYVDDKSNDCSICELKASMLALS